VPPIFDRQQTLGSPRTRRMLRRLHERPVNFSVTDRPEPGNHAGWHVDSHRQVLPSEPPGPPVPGGSWQVARRLVRDYEFADPRIVRAVYLPATPLEGRDMLLVGRFFGLRFPLGVRICGVVDEERTVDGRPARIWGWHYRTLQGHLEAGQMDFEVWKWTDTGAVEFRMRRFLRTAPIRNPVVWVGWRLFGRWMQAKFIRRAARRMDAFVRHELGIADERLPRPSRGVRAVGRSRRRDR
jgi:uncharacterized protein (UPF0548 family)